MIDKHLAKEFPKCPCCGAESPLVQQMVEEAKAAGMARQDWKAYFQAHQGMVLDQNRAILMPIGATVDAGYQVLTDICTECGCIWAVGVYRMPVRIDQQQGKGKLPPQFSRGS